MALPVASADGIRTTFKFCRARASVTVGSWGQALLRPTSVFNRSRLEPAFMPARDTRRALGRAASKTHRESSGMSLVCATPRAQAAGRVASEPARALQQLSHACCPVDVTYGDDATDGIRQVNDHPEQSQRVTVRALDCSARCHGSLACGKECVHRGLVAEEAVPHRTARASAHIGASER